jgi:hypothetical protein
MGDFQTNVSVLTEMTSTINYFIQESTNFYQCMETTKLRIEELYEIFEYEDGSTEFDLLQFVFQFIEQMIPEFEFMVFEPVSVTVLPPIELSSFSSNTSSSTEFHSMFSVLSHKHKACAEVLTTITTFLQKMSHFREVMESVSPKLKAFAGHHPEIIEKISTFIEQTMLEINAFHPHDNNNNDEEEDDDDEEKDDDHDDNHDMLLQSLREEYPQFPWEVRHVSQPSWIFSLGKALYKHQFVRKHMPMDGNCWFHSIATAIKPLDCVKDAYELRKEIVHAVLQRPEMVDMYLEFAKSKTVPYLPSSMQTKEDVERCIEPPSYFADDSLVVETIRKIPAVILRIDPQASSGEYYHVLSLEHNGVYHSPRHEKYIPPYRYAILLWYESQHYDVIEYNGKTIIDLGGDEETLIHRMFHIALAPCQLTKVVAKPE